MYLSVIFALLILLLTFKIFIKKKSDRLSIGAFILYLYFVSIFLTLFLVKEDYTFSIDASLYYVFILLLFIVPILKFKGTYIKPLTKNQKKIFNKISYLFIFLGLFSYVYFLPKVYGLFTSGASILSIRSSIVGGEQINSVGFVYRFLNLANQFFPIIILFYFYSVTFLKKKKYFNYLLLLSSTGYIINVLSNMGRDGFILWLLSYIFTFLLFRKSMTTNQKKKQKRIFSYFLGLALLFIVPITISRFFYDSDNKGYYSLLVYSGEQLANFNHFYNNVPNPENTGSLSTIFPVLDILKETKQTGGFLDDWENKVFRYGFDPNVFSSFIGSFYKSLGLIGTLIIGFIAYLLGSLISRNTARVDLSKLILITFFAQIVLHGFFYFKLGHLVSNIYILLVLFMSLWFKRSVKN